MEDKIEIGLFLGWVVMAGLVAVLIFFSQNYRTKILRSEKDKQLLAFKTAIEAVEREKEAIARNLHDEIITLLTSLSQNNKMHIRNLVKMNLKKEDFAVDAAIINDSISGMRAIALGLMPPTFLNFGLLKALEQYVRQLLNKDTLIDFKIQDDLKTEFPFNKNEQITIYRICAEILNNLQKHAYFYSLNISVTNVGKNYIFQFAHDGKGVTNNQIEGHLVAGKGFGLNSLKSRAFVLNATIDYKISESEKISVVTLIVPLAK